ncbi:MAG: NapC/NirT family cytochrome c [Acidobacteria bacterium]|nr:NapC/NirT family cytochrome c [Acidobacteriota bacterium]
MNGTRLDRWTRRISPLVYLSNNWISRVGVALVSAAGVFWIFLIPSYLSGHAGSAYIGIVLFLALPSCFFLGLGLIPAGIYLRRRGLKKRGKPEHDGLPVLSWDNPDFRRLANFVGLVTMANIVMGANLSYRAVEHMDGVQFCGATCHTVMRPEYTAYQNSPHFRVECVKCHIGPGASWFVKSKLSGVSQVFHVAMGTYDRPVPTPIVDLRPARETCEACHWPDKYGGDKLRVITHFSDEGARTKTVLLMRIGGGSLSGAGIHTAHIGQGIRVRYAHSDNKRQTIPWVEYRRNGDVREFLAAKVNKGDISRMPVREMDCVDCHNRPSHTFEPPERALENAMARGEIAWDLPRIKKTALDILKKEYGGAREAEAEIGSAFEKFYRQQMPEVYGKRQPDIARSARGVLAVWQRNVFPEMKVTWGTYANNIGHNDYPGCFRCHDGEHKTADGARSIEQDCNTCHVMLAMEEASPKILQDLGVAEASPPSGSQ